MMQDDDGEAEQAARICEEMWRELWNDEATPLVLRQYAGSVLKLAALLIRERVKPTFPKQS